MQIITRAKHFIRFCTFVSAALFFVGAHAEWTVDLSRRTQNTRTKDLREPASSELPIIAPDGRVTVPTTMSSDQMQPPPPSFFESLFRSGEISQEIVVLNTDKGFVPSTLRLRKGLNYQIHVVNVNEKEKNVSFVLDSFSEHHATYYGKIKSFVIRPQKEGVYKFGVKAHYVR
jgi:hypothetical protein